MKQLVKLFSIVFCAMAMYACGNDDEPVKSAAVTAKKHLLKKEFNMLFAN